MDNYPVSLFSVPRFNTSKMHQVRFGNTRSHHENHHRVNTRHNQEHRRYENVRNDHREYYNENVRRNHGQTRNRDRRGHYQQPQFQLDSDFRENSTKCRTQLGTAKLSSTKRTIALCLIYFGLLAAIAFQGCILAYQITVVTKRATHTDDSTPEFALYKNSLFESCSNNTTAEVDCALIEVDLTGGSLTRQWIEDHRMEKEDNYFMSRPDYRVYSSPDNGPQVSTTYTWCELASCLEGFKVIPSTPRDSAYGFTAMKAWSYLTMTALIVLLEIRKMLFRPEKCKGIGATDWLELVLPVASIGWWWWGLTTLARDPDGAEPVSLDEWIVTWALVASLDFHPWRCSHADSKPRKVIRWALHVVLFAQWCATIHAFRLQDREVFQRYDCLASGIDAAPGTSSCSAEDLCSKTWLFRNPDLLSDSDETALMFYKIPAGIALAVYPLSLVWLAARLLLGTSYWTPQKLKEWFGEGGVDRMSSIIRLFVALLFGYLGLCYAIVIFTSPNLTFDFDTPGGAATLAYDLGCRAVHVGVSPRYYYLDIEYGRALRIARMWFNT